MGSSPAWFATLCRIKHLGRCGAFALLPALLVAVPVLAATRGAVEPLVVPPPITVATGLQVDNHSGWRNTAQIVTLTATSTIPATPSDPLTVRHLLDGVNYGSESTTSGDTVFDSFPVSGAGSHTVAYWATIAGSTEATRTAYVNIDLTPPTVAAIETATASPGGWHAIPVTVRLVATDTPSGVFETQFRLRPAVEWSIPYLDAFTVSDDGTSVYDYRAVDMAGNESVVATTTVKVDMSAPTTTDNAPGSWVATATTVTLTPNDSLSGMIGAAAGTEYKTDPVAPWTTGTSISVAAPANHSNDGVHEITYRSTDEAGNVEVPRTCSVRIDTTTPTVTATSVPAPNAAGWNNTSVRVDLTAGDVTSGVERAQYRLKPFGEWSDAVGMSFAVTGSNNDGVHIYDYRAFDNAGNVSDPGSITVRIDTVPPVTNAVPPLAATPTSGWRNTGRQVALVATDLEPGSGVAAGGTKYQVNGGNWSIYGVSFSVDAIGANVVTYQSVDGAGNLEVAKTGYVNIETTAPTVVASLAPAPNAAGWNSTPVYVNLSAADAPSGVAKTQYRLQPSAGGWTDAVGNTFTVETNGVQAYFFQALDNAGNGSVIGTLTVRIDTNGPSTYARAATGTHGKPMALPYKVTDEVSPKAAAIVIKIRNAKGRTVKTVNVSGLKNLDQWYAVRWTPRVKGTYTYSVYAKDLAGNVQSVRGQARVMVR